MSFGDIAAFYARSDLLYLYLTATSSPFPLVLRLELNLTSNQVLWRVIAKSSGTTAGTVNLPRGIAVNPNGWVLAGFPVTAGVYGFFDTLVAFRTTFPGTATTATAPRFILRTNPTRSGLWDMASVGMTTDAAGTFYVATGVVGSSMCGSGGSSALVLISPDPNVPNQRCLNLPSLLARSRDVAVSPVENIPYLTAGSMVVRYSRLAAAPASTSSAAPAEIPSADISKLLALRV